MKGPGSMRPRRHGRACEDMTRASVKNRPPIEQLERVFEALADKTRLRIPSRLGNNEVCVCLLCAASVKR